MSASTTTGTDTQDNFFSASAAGCGIGIGGPNPISLPSNSFPTDGIYDPANTSSQLAAKMGANPAVASSYDAILKLSDGLTNVTLASVSVSQGHEDSLNLNDAVSNILMSGDFAINGAPGLRVITIKGGCSNVKISGTIHQHGTVADVILGDWSDQNTSVSSQIDLSGLTTWDGSPIILIISHATGVMMPKNGKSPLLQCLLYKGYWWFKRVVRWILRVPTGTPGPSWLS